ncbi:MAG: hypothetical protein M3P18_10345 [Actinomycetota bacterium]|nr:hypothetical protein [Actinomycetota bacterium]
MLFIGGHSGVGKSAAAFELHAQLSKQEVKHCVIEGDTLDLAYPAPWGHHLAERNLSAIWNNYRTPDTGSSACLIPDWGSVGTFRSTLAGHCAWPGTGGVPLLCFRRTASVHSWLPRWGGRWKMRRCWAWLRKAILPPHSQRNSPRIGQDDSCRREPRHGEHRSFGRRRNCYFEGD